MKRVSAIVMGALLALVASSASAQTVVNGNSDIVFTASADHNVVVAGVAKVTNYRLDTNIFTTQLGALSFQKNLGKPTPNAQNEIVISNIAEFGTLPQGSYAARVFAVGPGGEGASNTVSPLVRISAPAGPTNLVVTPAE